MVEKILEIVGAHYSFRRNQLTAQGDGKGDSSELTHAKQVATYKIYCYTTRKYDQIANIMGYNSKASVLNALNQIRDIASGNKAFAAEMEAMEQLILRK